MTMEEIKKLKICEEKLIDLAKPKSRDYCSERLRIEIGAVWRKPQRKAFEKLELLRAIPDKTNEEIAALIKAARPPPMRMDVNGEPVVDTTLKSYEQQAQIQQFLSWQREKAEVKAKEAEKAEEAKKDEVEAKQEEL